jgi:F0F1-type ATP synthase delta subunit
METIRMLVPVIVAHVCALVVIIAVIRRLLLDDTVRAVNRIKQVETEVRKKEEGIRSQIEEHEKEFATKRAEAAEELQKHKEEAEKEVSRMRDQVIQDSKKEADRIIAQAKKNEKMLREQIAQSMEEKAVDYGAEVFKLVSSEKITAGMNEHFVAELLDALDEIDAGAISVDGSEPEICSSHPLGAEQKARLEALLKDKFDVEIAVQEDVRPDLLAGITLKLGSLEIDGSLLTRYQEAAGEVKKHAHADLAA